MKRVYMLSTNSFFSQGIETLLHQEPGLEFVGRETDVERAIGCIDALHPDVVIITSGFSEMDLVNVLARVLGKHPETKIVRLNLHANIIFICHSEQVCGVEDLIRAIEKDDNGQSVGAKHFSA